MTTPSLVPPARLGVLLTEHRTRRGLTVEELCVTEELAFSADELRRIEQGQLTLTDDQVARLLRAYEAASGPVVPQRSELVIDFDHGALFAGRRTKVLPPDATFDDVLGRYLSLLYLMRGLEPGRKLALRGDDLEVLSAALERTIVEIEGRLFELMLPDQVAPWFGRLRHRLAVPAAGIFVGLTTVGSLVFVQFPKGERASVSPADGDTVAAGTLEAPPGVALVSAAEAAAAVTVHGDAETVPATVVQRDPVTGAQLSWVAGDPTSLGAAAETLISYDYRAVLEGWSFEYQGPREGYRGTTNTVTRTIVVHVEVDDTPATVADVLAHEVGHALDVMYLDDGQRDAWLELRGIDEGWWPSSSASDFDVGAGDFAEAVAAIIASSESDSDHGDFTAAELDVAATMIPEVSRG